MPMIGGTSRIERKTRNQANLAKCQDRISTKTNPKSIQSQSDGNPIKAANSAKHPAFN